MPEQPPVIAVILEHEIDDLTVGKRLGQIQDIDGNERPAAGLRKGKRCLVVAVKTTGKDPLLVEIFVGDDEEQMSAGFDELPPLKHGAPRIAHVLQAVRSIDKIELLMDMVRDMIGIAVDEIERAYIGRERIEPTPDVDAAAGEDRVLERPPGFFRLGRLIHGEGRRSSREEVCATVRQTRLDGSLFS